MRRDEQLERLDRIFDVLVIGGGATGLGVALDSASRGYATLLVEARDFAQGTSSRSTKLVHGGVRYLERGDIKLVYEALHERGRLIRNAPHLVHELRFLVPAYSAWQIPYYGIGLKAYDILAGRLGLSRSTVVGKKGATHLVPTIAQDGLKGGVIYSDAQFNDTRLAMILARTAVEHGATILNDAPVRSLKKDRGRIVGAVVKDTVSGRTYDIRARAVVNATGVFSDAIRQMDEPDTKPMMAPSQGVHLILDRSFLPSDAGILIPKTDDGRVVFIIPWQGHTLAGTTDTELPHPELEPTAHDDEIDFILEHVDRYLTRRPTRADVRAVFAGLRPLVRPADDGESTAALSRDHTLVESRAGLVTIVGGKWTTYRRMAQDTVDHVAGVAALPKRACLTSDMPLVGATSRVPRWMEFGATADEVAEFEHEYSGDVHPRLPYNMAMAAYVIEKEMPVRLEDVLARRLRALFLDAEAAIEAAPRVAQLMASIQGHDADWVAAEVAQFTALAREHYMVHDTAGAEA